MRKHRTVAAFLLCGASSFVLASGACAQSVSAAPTTAAARSGQTVEEIVVTAQRRAERTQDVPVTVNTASAATAQLLGATGTESLTVAAPGIDFSRQATSGGVPYVRGVGTQSASNGQESAVAVYIDDVYIASPSATTFSFNNIDQISVLKGPQGTLFGRNASGGVIQIKTRDPSATPTMDAAATYANYQTYGATFYGSTPLGNNLAGNLAAYGHKQDGGWGRDLTTNTANFIGWDWGVRGKLEWKPTEGTDVLLSADYMSLRTSYGLEGTIFPGYVSLGGGTYVGPYNSLNSPVDYAYEQHYGFSLKAQQELGWAKIVSITAWRRSHTGPTSFDLDSSAPTVIISNVKSSGNNTFSQELQLQSSNQSRLSWILGGYYFVSDAITNPLTTNVVSNVYAVAHLQSYATFADGTFKFSDATRLSLGLRYTHDTYTLNARTDVAGASIVVFPQRQTTLPKVTYRAVLDHHFTDDVMAYASYSRGFKSGGFNTSLGTVANPSPVLQPEVLDAAEVGLKSEFLEHRLQVNMSAFDYKYTNMQVTTIVNGLPTSYNAAAAKIRGFEFDSTAVLTPHLHLRAGFSVLDGEYSSFPSGPFLLPRHTVGSVETSSCATLTEGTGPRTGGNLSCFANLAGNTTIRTPKFTGTLSADYTINSNMGDWVLAATLYHNSGFFWEPDNQTRQPSYNLVNSSVTWTAPSGRYDVRVWGKNLLNEYYFSYAAETTSRFYQSGAGPRTYGVTVGVHF
jgi:iron complex outermembrane receptor protein